MKIIKKLMIAYLSNLRSSFSLTNGRMMQERTVEGGMVTGFRVNGSTSVGMSISHLLFVDDDTILFCGASADTLLHIHLVLMGITVVTGLKVNLSQTELVPVGEVDNAAYLAELLCCKVGSFPMVYLGMLLGSLCLQWFGMLCCKDWGSSW